MDRTKLIHALASMDDTEFADAVRDARGDDTAALSPMERAAVALRRHRGLDRTTKATPESAAAALRGFVGGAT